MTKKIKFSQKSPEIALCHLDYFFDQNGSFLRKMSVWKPSPSIYIGVRLCARKAGKK